MSFGNSALAVGLVGVVLVAGPVRRVWAGPQQAATPAAAKVDDGTLQSQISANLRKDVTIAARHIDVEVHEGLVTLKGVVGTAGEKARAAQLATVRGVTEVRNALVVDAAAAKTTADKAIDATTRAGEKTADATKTTARTTGEQTKEIVGTAEKKTKEIVSATGEAITDSWITAKVKAKFFDETVLKGSDISVETNDHVVTLKGTVASSAARARASAIAEGTEGVTRVVDRLTVRPR